MTHPSIVEAAHAALRDQFAPWCQAIVAPRDGRRRAEALRAELLKVI